MQLLARPSHGVSAHLRRQPALRTRLAAVPFHPLQQRVSPALAQHKTCTHVNAIAVAQHSQHEAMPPMWPYTFDPQQAALVPAQATTGSASNLLTLGGKAIACLAFAMVLCLSNTGVAFARSGGRAGGRSSCSRSASRASSSSGSRSSFSSHSHSSSSHSFGSGTRASSTRTGASRGSWGTSGISFPSVSFHSSPSTTSTTSTSTSSTWSWSDFWDILTIILICIAVAAAIEAASNPIVSQQLSIETRRIIAPHTVAVVHVAALAVAHQLKSELNEIATKADTSSPEGLQRFLQSVINTLQHHPEYLVMADSTANQLDSQDAAERVYNQHALEARTVYDEDTLVNYGGKPVRTKPLSAESNSIDELMVISLVVDGRGKLPLPSIRTADDLQAALRCLAALSHNDLNAVQLTWTPQAAGDAMSQEEVLEHFPQLRML